MPRLDDLTVLSIIGGDKLTEVVRALWRRQSSDEDEVVAVKWTRDLAPDERRKLRAHLVAAEKRLKTTVPLLEECHHSGLPRFYGITERYGRLGVVMEFAPGDELAVVLQKEAFSPKRWLSLARQLAAALQVLHAEGIFHGGISARNIRIDNEDIRLVDLGFFPDETPERYVAPEARKGAPYSELMDAYSLGVVLHEAALGQEFGELQREELAVRLSVPISEAVAGLLENDLRTRSSIKAFVVQLEDAVARYRQQTTPVVSSSITLVPSAADISNLAEFQKVIERLATPAIVAHLSDLLSRPAAEGLHQDGVNALHLLLGEFAFEGDLREELQLLSQELDGTEEVDREYAEERAREFALGLVGYWLGLVQTAVQEQGEVILDASALPAAGSVADDVGGLEMLAAQSGMTVDEIKSLLAELRRSVAVGSTIRLPGHVEIVTKDDSWVARRTQLAATRVIAG